MKSLIELISLNEQSFEQRVAVKRGYCYERSPPIIPAQEVLEATEWIVVGVVSIIEQLPQ